LLGGADTFAAVEGAGLVVGVGFQAVLGVELVALAVEYEALMIPRVYAWETLENADTVEEDNIDDDEDTVSKFIIV